MDEYDQEMMAEMDGGKPSAPAEPETETETEGTAIVIPVDMMRGCRKGQKYIVKDMDDENVTLMADGGEMETEKEWGSDMEEMPA